MITFSLTCPTRLEIKAGAHPTKTYRSVSGATRTRVFGSKVVGSRIEVTFACDSAQAAQAQRDYYDTHSGAEPIALPSGLFDGFEELRDALPSHLQWYMGKEPEISGRARGRVTVSVDFEGRLEV